MVLFIFRLLFCFVLFYFFHTLLLHLSSDDSHGVPWIRCWNALCCLNKYPLRCGKISEQFADTCTLHSVHHIFLYLKYKRRCRFRTRAHTRFHTHLHCGNNERTKKIIIPIYTFFFSLRFIFHPFFLLFVGGTEFCGIANERTH